MTLIIEPRVGQEPKPEPIDFDLIAICTAAQDIGEFANWECPAQILFSHHLHTAGKTFADLTIHEARRLLAEHKKGF